MQGVKKRTTVLQFEWDQGNEAKNWQKHRVKKGEAEDVFFDPDKQEYPDPNHSEQEERHIVIGKTKRGRLLMVVYTIRNTAIRVVSARDVTKPKEVVLYEKAA